MMTLISILGFASFCFCICWHTTWVPIDGAYSVATSLLLRSRLSLIVCPLFLGCAVVGPRLWWVLVEDAGSVAILFSSQDIILESPMSYMVNRPRSWQGLMNGIDVAMYKTLRDQAACRVRLLKFMGYISSGVQICTDHFYYLLSCFDMCFFFLGGGGFVSVSFALLITTHCGYRGGNHKYLYDADVSIDKLETFETHLVVWLLGGVTPNVLEKSEKDIWFLWRQLTCQDGHWKFIPLPRLWLWTSKFYDAPCSILDPRNGWLEVMALWIHFVSAWNGIPWIQLDDEDAKSEFIPVIPTNHT